MESRNVLDLGPRLIGTETSNAAIGSDLQTTLCIRYRYQMTSISQRLTQPVASNPTTLKLRTTVGQGQVSQNGFTYFA